MELQVVTLLALLASLLVLSNVNGVYGRRSLSMEEDLEFERQLKHLNKPPVKSIKTEHGEIYDCVDFYRQPAFDNPLLKNHKPEMSSLIPKEIPKEISPSGVEHLNLRLQGGGCPSGTVPIRRTTKEDLIRWKSFSNSSGNINQYIPGETHFAGYQLKEPNGRYHGASADLTVHTPRLLTSNQYSGALMWVEGGLDYIEYGWHVNPKLYGDNKTHIFGHWTADDSLKSGCFNQLCNGFVQVSKSLALGQILTVRPITEGHMPVVPMYLYQNTYSKNWIIAIGEGKMFEAIGYWPPELFNTIKDFAPLVGWRGEVYVPQGELASKMGTGRFPQHDNVGGQYQSVASFSAVRFYNETYIGVAPYDPSLEYIVDETKYYDIVDFPYIDDEWRHTFFYGGPGQDIDGPPVENIYND